MVVVGFRSYLVSSYIHLLWLGIGLCWTFSLPGPKSMARNSFSLNRSLSTCTVDRLAVCFVEALRICSVPVSSDHSIIVPQGTERESPQFISCSTCVPILSCLWDGLTCCVSLDTACRYSWLSAILSDLWEKPAYVWWHWWYPELQDYCQWSVLTKLVQLKPSALGVYVLLTLVWLSEMNAVRWGNCGLDESTLFLFWKKRRVLLVICPTLQGSPFRNCEIPCMLSLTQFYLSVSGFTIVQSRKKKQQKWIGALKSTTQSGIERQELKALLGLVWLTFFVLFNFPGPHDWNKTFVL